MIIETYNTIADKSNHFDSVNIDSKDALDKLIQEYAEKNADKTIIFRGLTEAKYKLFNSAQRFWNGEELSTLGRTYQEFIQTEINRAKSFHNNLLIKFYNAFGHVAYDLSILSFLQHYKAPTPLLDFTYNFDCALFFGIDGLNYNPTTDIGNYFSIYAIDTKQRDFVSFITHLNSSITQIDAILEANKEMEIDTTAVLNKIAHLQYSHFHGLTLFYLPGYIPNGIPFAIANRPNFKLLYNQHNLNVINQEGLFVFNSNPIHPLEDYFSGGYVTGFQSTFQLSKMKCWNIHKSLKEYVVRYLTENRPIPIDKEFMYPQEEFIASSAYKQFKNFL
jgi:FRG domain-containing protein